LKGHGRERRNSSTSSTRHWRVEGKRL